MAAGVAANVASVIWLKFTSNHLPSSFWIQFLAAPLQNIMFNKPIWSFRFLICASSV